jgi:energy-coupling factor transporter ATP-binding protein EcfA2
VRRQPPDLADVKGQHRARRALEIAAAGGHSLLMMGPPGTGKSTVLTQILLNLVTNSLRSRNGNGNGNGNGSHSPLEATELLAKSGKIVILTAQAHAGVDSVGRKLKKQNIKIVRAGSKDAQNKIHPEMLDFYQNRLLILWRLIRDHYNAGEGFVYLSTNMGIFGDSKCLSLLRMYLNGEPMSELERRYCHMMKIPETQIFKNQTKSRSPIRPVCAQDEVAFGKMRRQLQVVPCQ